MTVFWAWRRVVRDRFWGASTLHLQNRKVRAVDTSTRGAANRGVATQLRREVGMLWCVRSGLQAGATSGSQVMARGASAKVVFTLPLPSYFPLPYQFSRTLSLFPTPPLLYLLVREGRAQTPFVTFKYFSSLTLSPCLVYPIKSFINFETLFLRLSIPVSWEVKSKFV